MTNEHTEGSMTQELRKLAKAAINDEWRHVQADDCHGHYIETCGSAESICDLYFTTNKRHDFRNAEQNAAYIAAANPAAILALLDRLEKAEKDAARLDWLDSQGYGYGFEDMHEGNRWTIDGPFANVRIAIDEAMDASK